MFDDRRETKRRKHEADRERETYGRSSSGDGSKNCIERTKHVQSELYALGSFSVICR
jgi:hypothetical protein